jgi:hypothetical protein
MSQSRLCIIPSDAVSDKRLTHVQLRVLLAIGSYTGKDRAAFPKQKTVADMLGLARETVNRALAALKRFGYIEIEHQKRADGGQRENLYWVKLDPIEQAPCDEPVTPPVTLFDHTPRDAIGSHPRTIHKNDTSEDKSSDVTAPTLISLEQIAGKSRKPKPPQPAPDLQPALDAYNRLAERLRAEHGKAVWPVVTTFTAKRQAALRARIKEHGLEAWGTVLRKAYASPLCTGLRNSWAADFNFLTSPEGFLKTLEGNYDDRASANGSASRHSGSNGGRLEAFDRLADKLQERSNGPDAWQHNDPGAEGGDIIDIGPARLTG